MLPGGEGGGLLLRASYESCTYAAVGPGVFIYSRVLQRAFFAMRLRGLVGCENNSVSARKN